MTIENLSVNKSFGGWHKQYSHPSTTLNCDMRFAIYLPPQASNGDKVPVLYWLSGLTCSDENFMQKAGAQRIAAELGIAIVAPDTSPRGHNVADDEGYDLGQGAGFYVNATQAPWHSHYQMYDYIVNELPSLIESTFPVSHKRAIAGHSMGGHGALTIAMLNPERYSSMSAFSPICNPINCPWGQKAFTAYLGKNKEKWQQHDASELMRQAQKFVPARVDQGGADNFLIEQLKPEMLELAAKASGYPLDLHMHEGYDHSYYFIASFIEEHLRFHASYLKL
ncbi:S-formylglutathione hydrolase [Colwellia sp. 4_MG-2023]|jgi:S-formylglutathione hydrolase|uniref:S-formylglutathione hydrolase n=1 Tax=unclassified Colwellia TaxID=196834 RepID=UPI001C0835CD|nr:MULTISPECIES: S-formylglutathione hydrolase [unclassified Colwellia]MBU2923583.1 S-formylglutathione hydrolase [Colwellia sp. C2M11]MDO6486145.1 S-formylglutathione hydrolase [Colwellia sp. 6_MG-2023]MDO6505895.1 S-formylglutathione hydrolase [Colwellia sp. 5_MG-2023]MDO6554576.1 S-formylglutathione hydrolase [Colwellia sp. 4_MG-2023]MDO6653242.1 S-formylglutathione hydrolase [Colwellia sp. 3_MG-2023]